LNSAGLLNPKHLVTSLIRNHSAENSPANLMPRIPLEVGGLTVAITQNGALTKSYLMLFTKIFLIPIFDSLAACLPDPVSNHSGQAPSDSACMSVWGFSFRSHKFGAIAVFW